MATVYEVCQAIPDQLSYYVMPSINSYIKDRNLVDGQTDKLVWQLFLHGKEITANPFESSNSTAITNTTAMGQTGGGDAISMIIQFKPHENEFLAKDRYYQVATFQLTANNATGICTSNNCQFSIDNAEFHPNNASRGYVFGGILKSTVTKADAKISKFINMNVYLDKTGQIPISSHFRNQINTWKKHTTPLAKGQRIQYNFVKPHMALEGETPAKVAEIEIKSKNKWMALFENASRLRCIFILLCRLNVFEPNLT